ncbi:MAG: phosphate-starvation-inducible PsiE family protein [Sulfuricurvum sp.]|uniref:phosphate-starvation-inducible PsiE family protein n=1 Tax=Sulfuricurvum sp. TaxID=2025608 RepID=UPI00261374F4|nr:phosphate-starvation-inducible PsiE family protein [Sulfuricurvum sp.]MDD2829929.1 phosphate-starvation-inducible PsiE family protein [Sulfuricurvum sp.]MDD4949581.1 phosphate-starvation-inducible PsiE family protein [Sulfuricurvum sp.]
MADTTESPSKLIPVWEHKIEAFMQIGIQALRLFFIAIMIVYLFSCLIGLSAKLIELTLQHGTLDFANMKNILTDALFTLIVLAIVRTLFIRNGYLYALTLLEIGFVVIIRKLILLEVDPNETWLLLILGGISALFFGLIIFAHSSKFRSSKVI